MVYGVSPSGSTSKWPLSSGGTSTTDWTLNAAAEACAGLSARCTLCSHGTRVLMRATV